MKTRHISLAAVAFITVVVTTAASVAQPESDPGRQFGAMFGQLKAPATESISAPKAQLGRALFWDARLSVNGKVACASCHMADEGSADRRALSVDAKNKLTTRNSQPIFNATMQTAGLRWTGDRPSAAAQAEGSMTGSMGFDDKPAALANLRRHYDDAAFATAFPGDGDIVTLKNMATAIEAYEATLITPAPFDRYLAGDTNALSAEQKEGMRNFVTIGCAGCHSGALLGGSLQMKFGLLKNYWTETKSVKIDEGKFLATKNEADKHVFRVAMLRNVAETAPYFHDGSVAKLEDAVSIMADVQLGRKLTPGESGSIVAFLKSLSGTTPKHYAPPEK